MAIVCRNSGLLFFMAPRTGCTAVGEVLTEELGGEYLPPETIVGADGRIVVPFKHSTLDQLLEHDLLDEDAAGGLFKFTTVRNPFDSLVSLYLKHRDLHAREMDDAGSWIHGKSDSYIEEVDYCATHSFEEWIVMRYEESGLRRWLRPRQAQLYGRYTRGADFVMRHERLQEDFDEVLSRVGIRERYQIPTVNPTANKMDDYRAYHTKRTQQVITRAFAAYNRRYGYAH